jgi:SAM-dependent methyltransferase
VRAAAGRYAVVLAPDDAFHPEFLARTVEALEREPAAPAAVAAATPFGAGAAGYEASLDNDIALSAVYRRAVFLEVGGYRDVGVGEEDLDLWTRVTLGRSGVQVSQPVLLLRVGAPPGPAAPPPTATPYDREFYDGQVEGSYRSARRIVPLVLDLLEVGSVLDVGCGLGTFLRAFQENGVRHVLGVDGDHVPASRLLIDPSRFRSADLARGLDVAGRFDLAVSLEVAEHLPAERAAGFVADLCRAADVVLFSAAIPGQGGTHHVNEQWPSWWAVRFRAHGYEAFDLLRPALWADEEVEWWYRQNCLVFANAEGLRRNPRLRTAPPAGRAAPLDVAHPRAFEWKVGSLAALESDQRRVA